MYKQRSEIAKKCDELFSNVDYLKIPETLNTVGHSYHLYPLQMNFEKVGIKKSLFFEEMKNNGIKLQVHYIPVHMQPFYKKKFGMNVGNFQVAEQFYQNEFSLPVYTNLSINEFRIVTSHIYQYLN